MQPQKNTVSELIHQIGIHQHETINRGLRELELNEQQARSLNFIGLHPATKQNALARYLGKGDATITNLLKVLERRELISRSIPSDNSRQKQVSLTANGKKVVQNIQKLFGKLDQQMIATLTHTEQDTLLPLLQKVNQQFRIEKKQ